MNSTDLLAGIDNAIEKGKDVVNSHHARQLDQYTVTRGLDDNGWVDSSKAAIFRTSGLSLLASLLGTDKPAYVDFDNDTRDARTRGRYREALGVIVSVREQVEHGWLDDIRALLAADVFTDFMEMAKYLLAEGYDTPAAVLIGCTLEGHLRECPQDTTSTCITLQALNSVNLGLQTP
jgi:hypothetical protein